MPPLRSILSFFTDQILWLGYTFLTRSQSEGIGGYWGRKRRELALIRQLLVDYPGLSDKPQYQLYEVAATTYGSLYAPKHRVFTLAAAVVTAFACHRFANFLPALGYSLPRPLKLVFVVTAVILVTDQIRRWQIRSSITSAVTAAYPDLFCSCGYSRIGLPKSSPCPECGTAPSSPDSSQLI
jgi:hypothetical protein